LTCWRRPSPAEHARSWWRSCSVRASTSVLSPETARRHGLPNDCSIHHRAFDQGLVGISPDYIVHVSQRLLDEEDGPMLDVLRGFQGQPIELPRGKTWQPDRDLLASRFETFSGAA
jgi:hypothetical protein